MTSSEKEVDESKHSKADQANPQPKPKKKPKRKRRSKRKTSQQQQTKQKIGRVECVQHETNKQADPNLVNVRFLEGEVGIELRWNESCEALVIQDFPPLNDGSESKVKQSGLLALGATLEMIDGQQMKGLNQMEVIQELHRSRIHSPLLTFKNPPCEMHTRAAQEMSGSDQRNDADSRSNLRFTNDGEDAQEEKGERVETDSDARVSAKKMTTKKIRMPVNKKEVKKEQEALFIDTEEKRGTPTKLSRSMTMTPKKREPTALERAIGSRLEDFLRAETLIIWTKQKGLRIVEPGQHIEISVVNTSTDKAVRHYLGFQDYRFIGVTKNAGSGFWETRIHKLQPAPAKANKAFGSAIAFLGSFESEKKALQIGDKALIERSQGKHGAMPVPNKEICETMVAAQGKQLLTHLKIRVTCDAFDQLSLEEACQCVWSALEACDDLAQLRIQSSFSRIRKISFIGQHVQNLSIFQHLAVQVEVQCRKSSQIDHRESMLTVPEKIKKRIDHAQERIKHRKEPVSPQDVLNIVRSEDGVFSSLSEESRALLEKKSRAEEQALQQHREKVKQTKRTRTNPRAQSESRFTVFTKTDPADLRLWKTKRVYTKAAKSLQTIFRQRRHGQMVRNAWKLRISTLTAQRVVRGFLGRRRASRWRATAHSSAEKIQRFWHMTKAQKWVRQYKRVLSSAVVRIQAIARGGLLRRILAWRKRDDWAAVKAQQLVRGHLARVNFKRKMAKHFHEKTVLPAIHLIQRCGRGMLGRKIARRILAEKYHREVVLPSAVALQAFARQRAARKVLVDLKVQHFASMTLQRVLRGKIQRKRFELIADQGKRHKAASKIAALVRGYISRQLASFLQKERHHVVVQIPAANRIQAFWKGVQTRRWFYKVMKQGAAVIVLQAAWRVVLAKRKARETLQQAALEYKAKLATRLQASFRGYLGRRRFKAKVQESNAKRLWASRCIQRFWMAFKKEQAKEAEELELRRQVHYLDMELIGLDIDEVERDIEDVKVERDKKLRYIAKSKKLRKKIKLERYDMERRLPDIEHELNQLDPEDESLIPWKEAYETEIEMLTNILALSAEELDSKKWQIKMVEQEVDELRLELEELEQDLDALEEQRVQLWEEYRAHQVWLSEKRFRQHREKLIQQQRIRWKVRDVRRKVIERITLKEEEDRNIKYKGDSIDRVGTISISKRKMYAARDKTKLEAEKARDHLQVIGAYKTTGQNSMVFRNTFDRVVDSMRKNVADFTYDMRRPKTDLRSDPRRMCVRCGLVMIACKCDEQDERIE